MDLLSEFVLREQESLRDDLTQIINGSLPSSAIKKHSADKIVMLWQLGFYAKLDEAVVRLVPWRKITR